jgi:hypothetical protein
MSKKHNNENGCTDTCFEEQQEEINRLKFCATPIDIRLQEIAKENLELKKQFIFIQRRMQDFYQTIITLTKENEDSINKMIKMYKK